VYVSARVLRRSLAAAVAAAALPVAGVADARAAAAPGGVLSQLGGRSGCVYDPRGGSAQGLHVDLPGRCSSAESLDGAYDAAVTADGRNLYVGSFQADSISAFTRDARTGALVQVPGPSGCLVEQPFQTVCGASPGLDGISGVAVSQDGRNVYAASYFAHAVVSFARTRETGELTPLTCLSESEVEWECEPAVGTSGAASVAVSPDGRHVYVAGTLGATVAAFARASSTGALTQLPGTAACLRDVRAGVEEDTCGRASGLDGATSLAISPDGRNVYVTSFGGAAVAVLARNARTGALTPLRGLAGCLSEERLLGECGPARALEGAFGVTVSADGANVYVATGFDRRMDEPGAAGAFEASGVAVFARNRSTGALRQLAGRAGCISEHPTVAGCADGRALEGALAIRVSRDGRNAYVAASASNAISVFARDARTGALRQLAGRAGCISETGTSGACRDGTGLWGASSVVLSPDGRFAYAPGFFASAVTVFGRAAPARRGGR
jgi:DNA-binding beta-propeller fold protein YncE